MTISEGLAVAEKGMTISEGLAVERP